MKFIQHILKWACALCLVLVNFFHFDLSAQEQIEIVSIKKACLRIRCETSQASDGLDASGILIDKEHGYILVVHPMIGISSSYTADRYLDSSEDSQFKVGFFNQQRLVNACKVSYDPYLGFGIWFFESQSKRHS